MGRLVPDGGGSGDVVVAPATPAGTSALAVVRLTGPPGETLRVVRRLAPDLPDPVPPREACVAHLVDGGGEALDEAIVLFFEGPRSPTGEDVVEVCCHGSPAIVRGILEAARHAGARPARPGEFTRRALEHGKVDLARAEGIALLSSARSSGSARRAYGLARGDLSRKVSDIRERLLDLLSAVEAALDFPDDVAADDSGAAVVNGLLGELERLAGCRSCAASDGAPVVVIAGRANAGKSTLFNALVGSDRAIVTPVAGTTRDAVAEEIEIAGERVRLYDTAGFVDAPGEVERLGMEVAGRAAAGADLVLWLVDGNGRPETAPPLSAESDPGEGRRRLLVETKKDLWRNGRSACDGAMAVSAVTGEGLEELRRKIVEVLALQENEGEVLLLERHRRALEETAASLRNVAELTEPELSAAALRRALSALGEITGETASEEMIDRIFSSFCIGK